MSRSVRIVVPSSESSSPDRRNVRERLLAAAVKLVQTQSLQRLSQARVAAAAGLRQSHLTYYFPTRKDLIKAIVQTIHADMTESFDITVFTKEKTTASTDRIREFFAERIREPLMARLMLALMTAADEDPLLRQWLADFNNDLIERLRNIFLKLGLHPSDDELALLHASFIGAATLGAQCGTEVSADHAARLARLAFDRLIQAASPQATSLPKE